jgi:LPS-assembly protein
MLRGLRTLSILIFLLVASTRTWAQPSVTDGVMMSAENMFRDMEKKTILLTGNVQLLFKGQHLSCDKAQMDMEKQVVTAEGHVILVNDTAHVEGDRIVFNYKTNTGYIYNGFVQSGQVVFEGDVVEKVGEKRYVATNASYTACETCPPGWSFSGRVIDAEIGGYARIQRPVFRIAGVPVLILPSLIVPLKSSRQSGFLVPSLSFSERGGPYLSGIYFWAIDRSQDLTLTPRWYKELGPKLLGDYRYLLSKDSFGRFQGAWMLSDRALATEYNIPGRVSRWYADYSHYYLLPDDYVQRLQIRQLSDVKYLRDYPDEMQAYGYPSLENRASVTKSTDNNYASVEVDVYENLLKFYPIQRNEDSVNRFPEIRYNAKEQRLFGPNGPLARLDVDYTSFVSQGYNYDSLRPCNPPVGNVSGDMPNLGTCLPGQLVPLRGLSDPTGSQQERGYFLRGQDLWRTGQRLDVQPTISYPFQVAHLFDILPSISYREMQYRFDSYSGAGTNTGGVDEVDPTGQPAFDPSAARRYIQADVVAKTEFSRVFGDFTDPKGNRWKHSLEPEIGYSQIPWMRSPNHPFFGDYAGNKPSYQYEPLVDTDLWNPHKGVQFDYNDRVYDRRLANYVVTNRITRKVWNDGVPDYKTVALFQVGQSYDFKEASRALKPHPWSSIDSLLALHLQNIEALITNSYDTYADVASTAATVTLMATAKNFVQFSFNQNYLLNDDDTLIKDGQTRQVGIGGGVVTKYFDVAGRFDYSTLNPNQVLDWNYILNLRPPGRCWIIHLEMSQQLTGRPNSTVSLNFNFGGETTKDASTRSQAL